MIKFLKKLVIQSIIIILIIELLSTILFFCFDYSKSLGITRSYYFIKEILYKSSNSKTESIHLGDSVARQLFPPQDDESHLTINASILLSGQYYLIQEATKHNPNLKSIYLGVTPGSLRAEPFNPKCIQNHIKPFVSLYNGRWNLDYIKPFFRSHPKTIIYTTSIGKYLPVNEPKIEKIIDFSKLLSSTNKEYLLKINELCTANDIDLHFYSPPVTADRKVKLTRLFAKMNYANSELQKIMTDYSKTLRYIDKVNFKDQIHLTNKYLKTNKSKEKTIILSR